MKEITTKNYSLKTENGGWLGQVVLTSDGMFASVTDYGNLSFAWRKYGDKDFREFIANIDVQYFGGKMYQGNTYILSSEKCRSACNRFAEKILPALQKVLKEELEQEIILSEEIAAKNLEDKTTKNLELIGQFVDYLKISNEIEISEEAVISFFEP